MVKIIPSITGTDSVEKYAKLLELLDFSPRLHIDLSDGDFAPNPTINAVQTYWPDDVLADIHLMHRNPWRETNTLIALQPHLVTIHFEADDGPELTKLQMLESLRAVGVKVGLALLPETPVQAITKMLPQLDHVLIFSGKLGFYGGSVNSEHLKKVQKLKSMAPELEIGWDGGINEDNILEVARAGVSAITVGGYLQNTQDPHSAYAKLEDIVKE